MQERHVNRDVCCKDLATYIANVSSSYSMSPSDPLTSRGNIGCIDRMIVIKLNLPEQWRFCPFCGTHLEAYSVET